jgi:hypothetical protein
MMTSSVSIRELQAAAAKGTTAPRSRGNVVGKQQVSVSEAATAVVGGAFGVCQQTGSGCCTGAGRAAI